MTITNYLWDEDNYLEEYDEAGTTTAAYTNEPTEFGSVVSQHRNSQTNFYHYDSQGITQQLTDQNENVTDSFLHDVWGNEVARTGTTATPFRYIGEFGYYYDEETDSYYVRARIYQPAIARWTSQDPIGFEDGPSRYLYVKNNPTNAVDPSGSLTVKLVNQNVTGCGGKSLGGNANWWVLWKPQLTASAPCDGYIIQEYVASERLTACSRIGCCSPPREKFAVETHCWEAFEIRKGKKNFAGSGQDRWQYPPSFFYSQCGIITVTASMQFFCKDKKSDPRLESKRIGTGDLESSWGHSCGPSQGIPSTKVKPKWWTQWAGYELEEPISGPEPTAGQRSAEFKFNCCSGETNFAGLTIRYEGGKIKEI